MINFKSYLLIFSFMDSVLCALLKIFLLTLRPWRCLPDLYSDKSENNYTLGGKDSVVGDSIRENSRGWLCFISLSLWWLHLLLYFFLLLIEPCTYYLYTVCVCVYIWETERGEKTQTGATDWRDTRYWWKILWKIGEIFVSRLFNTKILSL